MLDFHELRRVGIKDAEYDEADDRFHWPNNEAIETLARLYPPDYLWGVFGTTQDRIVTALRQCGLQAWTERARGPSQRRRLWEKIERHVGAGLPVITIVSRGRLGKRYTGGGALGTLGNMLPIAHWSIIYRIEEPYVYVANTPNATLVHKERYQWAMYAWWMRPLRFRDCAIFAAPHEPPAAT